MINIRPYNHNLSASRKYGNNRMIVYSPKLNRQVVLYSNLEYYFYLFLEFDKEIIDFCEQPDLGISAIFNNQQCKSIADFWVKDNSKSITIIECKPKLELNNPKVIRQLHIQREWAINNDVKHKVVTEDYFKGKEFILSNYKKLHTAILQIDNTISDDFIKLSDFVIDYLLIHEEVEVQQILNNSDYLLNERNILPIIAFLYHQGKINLELQQHFINQFTKVKQI